jgi:hypothetical protein
MRQIDKLLDRLNQLETRLRAKADEVSGVRCIRAWLAGESDPYEHLGPPPVSTGPRSMRSLFYDQEDTHDATADNTISWPN